MIESKLAVFNPLWQSCNEWLPDNQQLSIPRAENDNEIKEYTLSFSSEQLERITDFMEKTRVLGFQFEVFKKKTKKMLHHFFRKIT